MATEYRLSHTASEIDEKLSKIDSLAEKSEIPTKTSELTNDSGFTTESYVDDAISNIDMPSTYVVQSEAPTDKRVLWVDIDDDTDETANIIPVKGVDYWTEEDRAEIKAYVDSENESSIKHFSKIELSCGEDLIVSSTAVTLGSGWTGSLSDGLTHSSGTAAVEIAAATDVDDYLFISFTLSAYQVGQLSISIGDLPLVDTYFGKNNVKLILKSDGGNIKFTPKTSFAVTISNLVVRKIYHDGTGAYTENLHTDTITHGNGGAKIGLWNVLLGGEDSVVDNVAATRIIAIGTKAMESIQYGTRSIAIGQYAMRAIVNSERNIAIGADALYRTTAGADNIAIGMGAMDGAHTNANRNVAVGGHAMTGATATAEENVAVGEYAGRYAGNRNTYVGMRSGYFMEGNGNVGIGSYSMNGTAKHSGNNNTAIGTQAQNDNATISNSTAIGYQAKCDKSNQVVIGRPETVETKVFGNLIVQGADGIKRQIVFNPDGSCTWEALNIVNETVVLTADDFTVGGMNADGTVSTSGATTTRMYTDILELPENGHVSVECTADAAWIVYFYSNDSGEASSLLGKSVMSSDGIGDIKNVTLSTGTVTGATHFRISLRNASSGSLTHKKEEMMGYVTVTITSGVLA